jgi:metal-responsive CopG/Arc/MetJ family transcriptional regulator
VEKTAKGNQLSRGERLQVMLDGDELAALDDFRFAHRMPSRAAAIRELLKRGLAAQGWTHGKQGASSKSYGVVSSSTSVDQKSG